jgi:hypothetical protein
MRIEIIVSPTGQTRVETKGFAGTSCRDASRFVESVLGKQTDEQLTQEYFQLASAEQREQQRQ